jgi:hypothetical protein
MKKTNKLAPKRPAKKAPIIKQSAAKPKANPSSTKPKARKASGQAELMQVVAQLKAIADKLAQTVEPLAQAAEGLAQATERLAMPASQPREQPEEHSRTLVETAADHGND